ncbi:MAG: hypothetical protein ACRD4M_09595 [Candidatus Acidiferrales bacterium]
MNFPLVLATSGDVFSQAPAAPSSSRARFVIPGSLDAPGEISLAASISSQSQQSHPAQAAAPAASASAADSPQVAKVRKAAGELESMLLQNWWGSMKESGFGGVDDSTDTGKDTLDQLGMQAMCAAVAKGGGLGIAKILVRSVLSKAQEIQSSSAAPVSSGIAATASDARS